MTPASIDEHRLAVMTAWGVLGSFGLCLVLSGFGESDPYAGTLGFAAFVGGFAAHLVINRIFGTGFSHAQISLGFAAFVVAAIAFVASCLFDPGFGQTNILVGFAGFGALTLCFVLYLLINYGLRGSYAMMHRLHMREQPRP